MNIDGCRVACEDTRSGGFGQGKRPWQTGDVGGNTQRIGSELGRWPANLIHDGSDEVVGLFPMTTEGSVSGYNWESSNNDNPSRIAHNIKSGIHFGDSGSAARFFYCAKASKQDRDAGNKHPTVKPTALMRYLCKLVTPPGGTILDPFMGSGSTGKAAALEGFEFIGIEKEPEYAEIAERRINAVNQGETNVTELCREGVPGRDVPFRKDAANCGPCQRDLFG